MAAVVCEVCEAWRVAWHGEACKASAWGADGGECRAGVVSEVCDD